MANAFERRLSKLEQVIAPPSPREPVNIPIIGVGEGETKEEAIARQYPDGLPPHGMLIFLIPVS